MSLQLAGDSKRSAGDAPRRELELDDEVLGGIGVWCELDGHACQLRCCDDRIRRHALVVAEHRLF